MNFKQLCSDILILNDPNKAEQMSAYLRYQFNFLGIQTAKRREVCQKYFSQGLEEEEIDWSFVEACWDQNLREFQYIAIDYLNLMIKFLSVDDFDKLKTLITHKAWWDTVDMLTKLFSQLGLMDDKIQAEILSWAKSDNIWLCRMAIIHQLSRKEKTNERVLTEAISYNMSNREAFVQKAIGWALREYSKTKPAFVEAFLAEHQDQLPAQTVREAQKFLIKQMN